VGDSTTVCSDQLLLAAGGDASNVYQPNGWAELQTLVQTISATACTITATPCTGCCGLCTCGQCFPAPKCFNPDICTLGVVDNTTKCCTTFPVTCPPKACNTVGCLAPAGCTYTPIGCKPNDTCTYWWCNPATSDNFCKQERKPPGQLPPSCNPDEVIDECKLDSDCGALDACRTQKCEKPNPQTPAYCKFTEVICKPSDNCTSRICTPGTGCTETSRTCNDYNMCTFDSCNPNVQGGCVYTDNSTCAQPNDGCKKAICHRDKGCIEVPVNCSERGYVVSVANCTIPNCNKTCFNQYVCFVPPPTGVEVFPTTVVLISALSTAAIIGIVVGAAVLVVGLGGAAGVAIAGAAGAGGVALVAQNPIYAPSGASGTNALFKDNT